jgi:TonB family protein
MFPVTRRWKTLGILLPALAVSVFGADPALSPKDMPLYGTALLRSWEAPAYPTEALRERVGGLVVVRIVVSETGAVTAARVLDSSDTRLADAALAAARKWVFSPALENGRPVAISMDAPVEFSPDDASKKRKPGFLPPADQIPQASPKVPAKPNDTYTADYPESLLDRKLSGLVRFKCTVNPDGHAVAVTVVGATHPDFVFPALRSLDRWTFTPGMQGDLPDTSEVEGNITFDANASGAAEVLEANHITGPDGKPPALQPEPRVVADPVWPYDLLVNGEAGSAVVTYTVSDEGEPQDVQVQSETKPEFGASLVAAVEEGFFVKATDGRQAAAVQLMQRAEFAPVPADANGDGDPVARLLAALRAKQVGDAKGLDERLTPIYRVPPTYPGALRKAGGPSGRAEIEFIIDRDGRARLPRIVSASNEAFGWSAATAVAQWVFKAPLRNGQHVDVRARIPFDFKAPAR